MKGCESNGLHSHTQPQWKQRQRVERWEMSSFCKTKCFSKLPFPWTICLCHSQGDCLKCRFQGPFYTNSTWRTGLCDLHFKSTRWYLCFLLTYQFLCVWLSRKYYKLLSSVKYSENTDSNRTDSHITHAELRIKCLQQLLWGKKVVHERMSSQK